MKILDYDEVNPLQVLHLTMLALDFPLTPEHAAHIRHMDPRPFPCFTVNAVEDDVSWDRLASFDYRRFQMGPTPECASRVSASPHSAQLARVSLINFIKGMDMFT